MKRTQFLITASLLCALSSLAAPRKTQAYGSEQQEWLSLLDQCDKVWGHRHPATREAFDYVRRRVESGKVSDLHRFVSKSALMSQCRRRVDDARRVEKVSQRPVRAEKVQQVSGSLDFAVYARPTPARPMPFDKFNGPAEPSDPAELSSRRFFDGAGKFPDSRVGLLGWVTEKTAEVRVPTAQEVAKGSHLPETTSKFTWDDPFNQQMLSIGDIPSPSLLSRKSIDTFAIEKIARIYKAPYDIVYTIVEIALMHNISPALALAMTVAESNFNPKAVSHKNAQGLMQLLPKTAKAMGVDPSLLHIPKFNVTAGVRYIKEQLETFKNVALALAAYNAGPGAVQAAEGIPKFKETRLYVPKIIRHYFRINEILS